VPLTDSPNRAFPSLMGSVPQGQAQPQTEPDGFARRNVWQQRDPDATVNPVLESMNCLGGRVFGLARRWGLLCCCAGDWD
jgi:hypothetical protein